MITLTAVAIGGFIGGLVVAVGYDFKVSSLKLRLAWRSEQLCRARYEAGRLSRKIYRQKLQLKQWKAKVETLTPPEEREARKQFWLAKKASAAQLMGH